MALPQQKYIIIGLNSVYRQQLFLGCRYISTNGTYCIPHTHTHTREENSNEKHKRVIKGKIKDMEVKKLFIMGSVTCNTDEKIIESFNKSSSDVTIVKCSRTFKMP